MFFKNINFKKFSSIKIGNIQKVLIIEKEDKIPKDYKIIGAGKNTLFSNNPSKLMMLSKDFSFIYIKNNILYIGASTPIGKIISFVKKNNIANFEFMCNLPGSLGGLLAMNAGLKEYEIFNIVEKIEINRVWKDKKDIEYGYRFANLNGVVTEASFNITKGFNSELVNKFMKMRSNQPKEPNIGSIFKNPNEYYAGFLIQEVGLKGKKKGNMGWSNIHSNFLVNYGNGSYKDALFLIELAKEKVYKKFNIKLVEEIIIR